MINKNERRLVVNKNIISKVKEFMVVIFLCCIITCVINSDKAGASVNEEYKTACEEDEIFVTASWTECMARAAWFNAAGYKIKFNVIMCETSKRSDVSVFSVNSSGTHSTTILII